MNATTNATQRFETTIAKAIESADDFVSVRMELLAQLGSLKWQRDTMDWDANLEVVVQELEGRFEAFEARYGEFRGIMRGACEAEKVLTEVKRRLTAPGDGGVMAITPYVATVYVQDWNAFASIFDGDFEYTAVTPVVRDMLLALTYAPRSKYFGTSLELLFDMSSGRFCVMLEGGRADVFVEGVQWTQFVDVARANRMRDRARTAGAVLWTLTSKHKAVLGEDGQLVLNSDVGDALRRAHQYTPRGRNLAVPVRFTGRRGAPMKK